MAEDQKKVFLAIPREDAEARISGQIAKGDDLLKSWSESRFTESSHWSDYTRDLLKKAFTTDALAVEVEWAGHLAFKRQMTALERQAHVARQMRGRVEKLRSIHQRLELFDVSAPPAAAPASEAAFANDLHPRIHAKCSALYKSGHFTEAVEMSFKVVRDRLRELSSFEKASEAFGKGKLHIKGAASPYVDSDFNEGARFLMMSIDMFRNEKVHTSDAKIADPARARQYLMVSSLAMSFLDEAEVR